MDTRPVQTENQLVKHQQDMQVLAQIGSVCGGLISNPMRIAETLTQKMGYSDSSIEFHRVVEITFWEE